MFDELVRIMISRCPRCSYNSLLFQGKLQMQNAAPFLEDHSACATGLNIVDDLADKSIQLASASQLAGFRHVVGLLGGC